MPSWTSHRITRRLATVMTGTVVVSLAVAAPSIAAAGPYSSPGVIASVSARTVTTQVTIKATTKVNATMAGICARNATGGNVDFPFAAAVDLLPAGTTIVKSRTLNPGTYSFWACAKVNGKWNDISAKSTFSVSSTASGEAMPVGNLPSWKQIFTEDFNANVAVGGFPGPYAPKWDAYDGFPDSSGNAQFSKKIISTHDGMLDMYLHTENGVVLGAAPVPLVTGVWQGQVYGRYSVRFKADSLGYFGTGWVLWPDSNDWNEGEIDFPEGSLDNTIAGFVHCIGHAQDNCAWLFSSVLFASSWHTATIEWKPTSVTFYLDGHNMITNTNAVPKSLLHWVLQTATNGGKPKATTAGHVLIDWATIYGYTG
ncbi:hypothetical protein ABIB25_001358 [Nakamurella sp. UYEF19]|uniref:glycoside hydrolase family 16 protein n=1 Tax=Nakamurella sp. UYEF19 TaxID=1756392 RepID=UPI003393BB74